MMVRSPHQASRRNTSKIRREIILKPINPKIKETSSTINLINSLPKSLLLKMRSSGRRFNPNKKTLKLKWQQY